RRAAPWPGRRLPTVSDVQSTRALWLRGGSRIRHHPDPDHRRRSIAPGYLRAVTSRRANRDVSAVAPAGIHRPAGWEDTARSSRWKFSFMAEKFLHYDVLEKLGEGAKSIIYRVSDPATGRIFALKH